MTTAIGNVSADKKESLGTQFGIMKDTGYTHLCGNCSERWGGPKFGERAIELTRCESCADKISSRGITAYGINSTIYDRDCIKTPRKEVGYFGAETSSSGDR